MKINKKLKKSIVTILTLLLLMSSIPSFAATTRFKDVPKKHWAYSYVEDMSKLGFLSGYPDGRFLPSGDLTFLESMSTLSRFVNLSSADEKKAMDEYSSLLKELKVTIPWEKEGLSIALYSDIISESQLREASKQGIFNRPISREVIAEFLAKAMKLEEIMDSKLIVVLPYKDQKEINPLRVKYVDALLETKVLSPDGKGEGKFEPKSTLTRAEMSTLLSKGYEYLRKNPIKVEPEKPKPVEKENVEGRIEKIEEQIGRRKITLDNGLEYMVDIDSTIEVDGKKASLSNLHLGQWVKMEVVKSNKNILSIKAESLIEDDVDGLIKYLNLSLRELTLEYKDGNKINSKDYDLDKDVKVSLDGKSSKLADLRVGDRISLKIKNNLIIEIDANSKNDKREGIITEITPVKDSNDKEYYITIVDEKDNTYKFFADEDTYIYRNKSYGKIKDLKLRDEAYIISEYDLIKEHYVAKDIEASIVKRDIKGYVVAVSTRYNENTKVVIRNEETKKEETYEITSNASIKIDNSTASSLPTNPGYYVKMRLEGDVITEIDAETSSLETSLIGDITYHDSANKTIEVKIDNLSFDEDRKIKVYVDKNTKIFSGKTLKEMSFTELRKEKRVYVVGTYQGANFVADTIQTR